jgi:hypothetical protein
MLLMMCFYCAYDITTYVYYVPPFYVAECPFPYPSECNLQQPHVTSDHVAYIV